MKIKFASTKLVFNNANECQTGRSFVVSLSELVNGNSYKLVLQKTTNSREVLYYKECCGCRSISSCIK